MVRSEPGGVKGGEGWPRGRHRRRREPRPCFGELVHLDGSRHPWLALGADVQQTLNRRGGRRDQAAALRPARGRGRESGGDHDGAASGARASTASRGRSTPPGRAGRSHADVGHGVGPHEAHPGRPGPGPARDGADRELLAPGPRAERARERHAARAPAQRAAGRRDPDPRRCEPLPARRYPGRRWPDLLRRGIRAPSPCPLPLTGERETSPTLSPLGRGFNRPASSSCGPGPRPRPPPAPTSCP